MMKYMLIKTDACEDAIRKCIKHIKMGNVCPSLINCTVLQAYLGEPYIPIQLLSVLIDGLKNIQSLSMLFSLCMKECVPENF